MQSTIHSCLSRCGEVIEMVRDFSSRDDDRMAFGLDYMEDMNVGMETCAL